MLNIVFGRVDNIQLYKSLPKEKYNPVIFNISRGGFIDVTFSFGKKLVIIFFEVVGKTIFVPKISENIENLEKIIYEVEKILERVNLSKQENQFFITPEIEKFPHKKWIQNPSSRPESPILGLSSFHQVAAIIKMYLAFSDILNNRAKILDVGCGSGIGTITLLKKFNNVYAIDKSELAIEIAKSFDIENKAKFIIGDIKDFPSKEKFDAVIAADVIEHNENPEEIIEKLSNLIYDDGKIFVNLPEWKRYGVDVDPYHKTGWSLRKIERVFSNFSIELINGVGGICFYLQKLKEKKLKNKEIRVMIVVHNIPKYERTGTPIWAFSIAKNLNKKGIATAILAPISSSPNAEKEVVEGIPVYKVPPLEYNFTVFEDIYHREDLRWYLTAIENVILDFSPDVVHVLEIVRFSPKIYQLFKDLGCKIVVEPLDFSDICHRIGMVVEETEEACSGPELQKCAICVLKGQKTENEYHTILRVSELIGKIYAYQEYRKYIAKKLVDKFIFYYDLDYHKIHKRYLEIPSEKIFYVKVPLPDLIPYNNKNKEFFADGRIRITYSPSSLTKFKAVPEVIELFKRISNYNNFILKIYSNNLGNPKYFKEIEELSQMYPNKIKFCGSYNSDDFHKIAEDTDIALAISNTYEFNLTLRSFIYYGVPPILSSNTLHVNLKDGENCLIVNTKDFEGFSRDVIDMDSLQEKVEMVLKNPSIIYNLWEGVIKTKENFLTIDKYCDELISLYHSL